MFYLLLLLAVYVFIVFFALRVLWVFENRTRLLNKHGAAWLKQYASYDTMVLMFWLWDIEKFRMEP